MENMRWWCETQLNHKELKMSKIREHSHEESYSWSNYKSEIWIAAENEIGTGVK